MSEPTPTEIAQRILELQSIGINSDTYDSSHYRLELKYMANHAPTIARRLLVVEEMLRIAKSGIEKQIAAANTFEEKYGPMVVTMEKNGRSVEFKLDIKQELEEALSKIQEVGRDK